LNVSEVFLTVLWPFALYFLFVLILTGGILGVSYVLGQKHKDLSTWQPYESGIPPTGSAHVHFDVKFYLNAMFFVVFDLETMFIFAWAVAFRESGWAGFIEMAIFIVVLAAALVYLWRMGALDWSSRREQREKQVRIAQERAMQQKRILAPADGSNQGTKA
jgi:NADH-quinone oxidoreductase subunit A